jgi:hypothetical protein
MTTVTIKDASLSGETLREFALELLTERITVRELIRSRVYQEVDDYNAKGLDVFQGLVEPSDAEKTLNGWRPRRPRQIAWQPQFEAAVAAFERNRILILVDDEQAESLDQSVLITPKTTVSFLKLVPLVGG